ncbi:cephalosporin-C deacetylase-like acetyl esterase [Sphingobacterium sp. JUb78]|uniref:acetylxylan esterase n=2 Tax=Sphingobacterium TaxID=28453 RepID=UPI001043BC4D|nr:cephalosporin-C deacetylase-like acetyl esterase [Sphingobacterium sp. JUb78]
MGETRKAGFKKYEIMNIYSRIAVGILLAGTSLLQSCHVKRHTSAVFDFGADWKFHAGEGLDSNWSKKDYQDKYWKDVISNKTLVEQGQSLQQGFGWYRKTLKFSNQAQRNIRKAEGVVLDLGKFAACEEVYVNGTLIGKTGEFPNNFAGYFDHERTYFVPIKYLDLDKENSIAIKFFDGWSSAGGFLNGAIMKVQPASTADKLILNVNVRDDDYVFLGTDSIAIAPAIVNKGKEAVKAYLNITLTTDDGQLVNTQQVNVAIPGNGSLNAGVFGLKNPKPGFYQYKVSLQLDNGQKLEQQCNVGYEPEKISSPNDARADFDEFWKANKQALAAIEPDYQLILLPEQSRLDYDMYQVSMRSLDNELIMGYYAKPKKSGKHPVIVEYMGYGSKPYFPNQSWDGFAYFVLSIRGQALNEKTNRFGTWFTHGIFSQDEYYYKGAFMDVVRALDFVSSRTELDANRIAVRGSSQGGALSVVAASLDTRVKALAIGIPFLSDYKDYFKIAPWPKSDVDNYLKQHTDISLDQVYKTLSYFDIKNLASRIRVPLIMGIGMQDHVCPPHINFAAYNQVQSEKSWIAFPKYGHSTGNEFHVAGLDLFRRILSVEKPD